MFGNNKLCNFDFINAEMEHSKLEDMPSSTNTDHDGRYIKYDTFAGNVYTLSTASITLTAGTLTAAHVAAGQSTFTNTSGYQICLAYNVSTVSTLRTIATGALEIESGDSTIRFQETDGHATVIVQGSKDTGASNLILRRAKGTTASPTALTNNIPMPLLTWSGYDGSAYQNAAQIRVEVEGSVSSGIVPTQMELKTTTTGGALTTALTLSNTQAASFASTLAAGAATFTSTGDALRLRHPDNTWVDFVVGETGCLTITPDDAAMALEAVVTVNSTLVLASGSITDSGGTISFGNENLDTSGVLTVTGISRLDGGLGIGIDPTSTNLVNISKSQNAIDAILLYNPNTGTSTQARLQLRSGSGSTYYTMREVTTRYGVASGSYGELFANAAGLLIGTQGAGQSVVIGTEVTRAIKIDGTNQTIYMGLTDTNSTQIDTAGVSSQHGTAKIGWAKYTAGAVDVTGFTEVGQNDAWLQSHDDGTVFTATEVAGGNNDVTVNFTGVTAFNWVQVLFRYEGSASHHICVQLEVSPFNGSTWETFGVVRDQPADECNENASFFIAKSSATYINSGVVKVRLLHTTTTVNNHLLVIDEVALYQ